MMEDDDNWEERIEAVLGSDTDVCSGNFAKWRDLLLKNLTFPLRVTGIEDFPWEEPYVFGAFDADEYERLKKTNPSYTDQFDLIGIGEPEESDDLIAEVRRVSDKKMFDIGLSSLQTTEEKGAAYKILNDYSVWQCNY
jgi:hypothetical protein